MVLGSVELIDANGIDVAQYMVQRLSDVSLKTGKKHAFLRIGDFEKLSFFESAILKIHLHENESKLLGYQGWVEILIITLVYSKRVSVHNNL